MIFSKNPRPKVLPSDKTLEEINNEAQARLKEKKKAMAAYEKYLFGAPKKPKHPKKK